jgi:hypothetical protein
MYMRGRCWLILIVYSQRRLMMSLIKKSIVFIILLIPGVVLGAGPYETERQRDFFYTTSNIHYQNMQGWDVDSRRASEASNCYYYSLRVAGGRGSARIMSLSGKNYIQSNAGERHGYVCFNGPTTLELGKLGSQNVSVELEVEDIGTFYFGSGDHGSKFINNWYRSYQGI